MHSKIRMAKRYRTHYMLTDSDFRQGMHVGLCVFPLPSSIENSVNVVPQETPDPSHTRSCTSA